MIYQAPFFVKFFLKSRENPFKVECPGITIDDEKMDTSTLQKIFSRDFFLACCAQFVFACVINLLLPTLPLYLSRLGATEVEIGVLIGSFFVSALALRLFVGRGLAKIPEKSFMIAGALLFGLTSLAYIIAPPFWPFLVVRLLQGVGLAFFHTAGYTLVARISSPAHRAKSISYFILAFNVSGALGPPLGMLFVNYSSFTVLFLVCAGLSVGSLLITMKLGQPERTPAEDASIDEGSFFSRKALPPSIVNALTFLTWGSLHAFFPLYAIQNGVTNPGVFFSVLAVTLILGRTLGGRMLDMYSTEKIILPCILLCTTALTVLAFSKTLPMFILAAVILGAGYTLLTPSLLAITMERSVSSHGLAMGTFTAVADLALVLGPVIMGMVIYSSNYTIMFLSLAFIELLSLFYFHLFVRNAT
jgi:MFS family permease